MTHILGFLQMKQTLSVPFPCWNFLATFEAESGIRRFWLSVGKSQEGLPL